MVSKEVEEFRIAAAAYCDFIDSCSSFDDKETLIKLLSLVSRLYTEAFELPEVELEGEHTIDVDFPLPEVIFQKHNVYKEIFNPYHDTIPVNGCLDDDITDIYSDIKNGLLLYEQGHDAEAVWEWKFSFEVHWGEHATSAIRALHSINYQ
ncbi:DUF5063 domain-containing protein [Planococcus shenhongbingii]|uniref:DUF5063 domain-containing protein n=1 Tax=Planococcus shenhongbingii TaxID=3058398 RepID=A0ABT8NCF1_9BACL|nr:DUF5063 domain-containing protein [Planococcus sp. N017]MDN7245549.1 DUF5063 domain-containing protein [Planococcus sp. N017]